MKTGMAFGVFDGLHEGHRHFLTNAQAQCERLIVVLPSDETVRALKGKGPVHTFETRAASVRSFGENFHPVVGDATPGSWDVLARHSPDIIFIGHDQEALAEALAHTPIPLVRIDAHHPDLFKSSLLNNR